MAHHLSVGASRFLWALFFLITAALAGHLAFQSVRAMNSRHWPVTEGEVFAWYGAPNFRYHVAGETYEASRVSCNELFEMSDQRRRANGPAYLHRYPLGSKVRVHYHPRQPQIAVLETEFDAGVFKVLAAALAVGLLCAIGFWRGWRWRLRRRRGWQN